MDSTTPKFLIFELYSPKYYFQVPNYTIQEKMLNLVILFEMLNSKGFWIIQFRKKFKPKTCISNKGQNGKFKKVWKCRKKLWVCKRNNPDTNEESRFQRISRRRVNSLNKRAQF